MSSIFKRLIFAIGLSSIVSLSLYALVLSHETIDSVINPKFAHQLHHNLNVSGKMETQQFNSKPNYNIHAFYYAWYGNPVYDDIYYHWNHEYLASWRNEDKGKLPTGLHKPPDDIGASFYPLLGPYSSKDPIVLDQHMRWMADTGIGVVVHSWYPPGDGDDQQRHRAHDSQPDALTTKLLDIAHKHDLKVAIHIEPYKDRTVHTLRKYIKYLKESYGNHPALYKIRRPTKTTETEPVPLIYIYDSYLISPELWRTLLCPTGHLTIRNTEIDAVVIGLLLKKSDVSSIVKSCFDGFYTYFAAQGFTEGSTVSNWPGLADFATQNNLLFIPSVGPGYDDERVRVWNSANTKDRKNGEYYKEMWKAALGVKPPIVSITSFNEWHEGTQIEPAKPFSSYDFIYRSYQEPMQYLELTKYFARKMI